MANVYATKSGNWSDTTVWNTLALPTVNDDVFANNFTVYIDIDTQVLSIRTTAAAPAVAGGSFRLNHNVSLSANVLAGTTTCLTFLSAAPNFCTVYGGLTGGTGTNIYGFNNTSTGTAFIYGLESSGGTGSGAAGINNNSRGSIFVNATIRGRGAFGLNNNNATGFIFLTGNVFGSQTSTNIPGLNNVGTCVIYGDVAGGPQVAGGAGGNAYGINNSGASSNLTVYGNISGARAVTATGYGIFHSSTAITNIIGDVYGLTSPSIFNSGTGIISITGNCIGGISNSSTGVTNNSTGVLRVVGSAIGGSGTNNHGILNNSSGYVLILGNVAGGTGTTAYGAVNNATGYLEVNGLAIGNGWGLGSVGINSAPGIFGSQAGTTIIRGLSCGARGLWPTAGVVLIRPESTSTATFETSAFQEVTLFTSLSDGIVPPVSSVRQGTVYNLGDYRGTCVIPSVSSVLQGVSVDNSVGITALQPQTIWNYSVLSATDVDSLGGRLKEVATVQSVGQQLTALN